MNKMIEKNITNIDRNQHCFGLDAEIVETKLMI